MKDGLRRELIKKRSLIAEREKKDAEIAHILLNCDLYLNARTVLFYASVGDEVNTKPCIEAALEQGKKVALPVCTDKNGNMKFYYINSFDCLKRGLFGISEPDVLLCRETEDFSDSVCIVPGVSFDRQGYRLGYGKGYYDRFLKNYTSHSIGLCYNELIEDKLPTGDYDIPVGIVITEKGVITA